MHRFSTQGRAARHWSTGKAELFRGLVAELLPKEPELLSVEIPRRAKLAGYTGGKTALYDLVSALRPTPVRRLERFEGLWP